MVDNFPDPVCSARANSEHRERSDCSEHSEYSRCVDIE